MLLYLELYLLCHIYITASTQTNSSPLRGIYETPLHGLIEVNDWLQMETIFIQLI